MKTCTKCGIEKDESEFSKNKNGIRSACKKCLNLENKLWRENNPDKQKKAYDNWVNNNREKNRIYQKKHRELYPEKVNKRKQKWRENNHDAVIYCLTKQTIKKQIGATPPPELVEIKILINKTKKLCKTLKN